MSWPNWSFGLASRIGGSPVVLCGPILRKVTPQSVTVWLALKEAAIVTLEIRTAANVFVVAENEDTIQIGPHLHLVVITVRPEPDLSSGTTYLYDLSFVVFRGAPPLPQTLTFSEAVGGDPTKFADRFAYGSFARPSFALPPPTLEQLRIVHGSCRKPHASGPDAMATLSALIAASANDPLARPHQLVLSGDQIYADEVADVLLPLLTDAGRVLVGVDHLPTADGSKDPKALLPTTRTAVVRQAKFTSDDTRSHLLSFGEFMAMYLFVWSDVLWPALIPTSEDVEALVRAQGNLSELGGCLAVKSSTIGQRNNLVAFAATLPAVRRVLANVPTYMTFDDHEVTDDWNMYKSFCEQVYGNDLGMRVIQNGLVAYALCQHWGNAPEQFASGGTFAAAGRSLLTSFAFGSYDVIAPLASLRKIVGLHTPSELVARAASRDLPYALFHEVGQRREVDGAPIDQDSLIFNYTIEGPRHQIVVTDTRTWRSFPADRGGWVFPDLIAADEVARQLVQVPDLAGRQLIVVISTNILALPGIRQAGRDLPTLPVVGDDYRYEDMGDSWEQERVDFARLLAALSHRYTPDSTGWRKGAVVVLSGDVHSSSTARITYWAHAAEAEVPHLTTPFASTHLAIVQLVASALHNGNAENEGFHKAGYTYVPPEFLKKLAAQSVLYTENFLGWDARITEPKEQVGRIQVRLNNSDAEPKIPLWFEPDKPTVTLRFEDLAPIWESEVVDVWRTAHYRFRIDYLIAADGSRYTAAPPPMPPATPFNRLVQQGDLWALFRRQWGHGSEVVGRSNVGEVKFTAGFATHIVHWPEPPQTVWVRFDASLALDDLRYPMFLGPSETPP